MLKISILTQTTLLHQNKFPKIEFIIISIIWIEFHMLIHQTNLMHEARKATIDAKVLNMTELGEPIGKIKWKTVYKENEKRQPISLLTTSFTLAENARLKDCLSIFRKTLKVFIKVKDT